MWHEQRYLGRALTYNGFQIPVPIAVTVRVTRYGEEMGFKQPARIP
jgi:hypothetical protein